jgi:SSS family solute:Na+ symporter
VGALVVGILIALHGKNILYTIIIFLYPYMGSMLVPLLEGVLWGKATARRFTIRILRFAAQRE